MGRFSVFIQGTKDQCLKKILTSQLFRLHSILLGREHTYTSIKLNQELSLPTEYECSPLRNKVFSDKKKKNPPDEY